MATPEKHLDLDTSVTAVGPDRTIRELIGTDIKLTDVFTKEKIEACQKTIDDGRNAFFNVAHNDLAGLEVLMKEQAAMPDKASFEDIAARAANIKGHAELFGFTLIAAIVSHILDACEPGSRLPVVRFRLITDLTKLLRIAITEEIKDERGTLGRELRMSLQAY
jgi:hypothetical protein